MMKTKKLAVAAALGVTLLASAAAQAHRIWFAQRATQLALQYGVGADDLDMVKRASYVTSVTAYGADGKEVPTSLQIDAHPRTHWLGRRGEAQEISRHDAICDRMPRHVEWAQPISPGDAVPLHSS